MSGTPPGNSPIWPGMQPGGMASGPPGPGLGLLLPPGLAPLIQAAMALQQIPPALNAILTALGTIVAAVPAGSSAGGISAHPGGGQSGATPLTAQYNQIDIVATANDSVLAPQAVAGMSPVYVFNAAPRASQIFGTGTDTINGSAAGVSLPSKKAGILWCAVSGSLIALIGA